MEKKKEKEVEACVPNDVCTARHVNDISGERSTVRYPELPLTAGAPPPPSPPTPPPPIYHPPSTTILPSTIHHQNSSVFT
ncbi:hypothetical protein M0802_007572 [Mischocyttarus mexicanus]|nr:hypothetical protein M0802_016425 [Mischocyttarus mexicanus]KAI4497325.1 hypothetical protein M0802_007572 [Mischocyttarus mexicanus]